MQRQWCPSTTSATSSAGYRVVGTPTRGRAAVLVEEVGFGYEGGYPRQCRFVVAGVAPRF